MLRRFTAPLSRSLEGQLVMVARCHTSSTCERKTMAYEKRLEVLMADPECPLSQLEYKVLQEKLAMYQELQGEYSVKQSDIERTKKVANFCGLDFPEPRRRSASEMSPVGSK